MNKLHKILMITLSFLLMFAVILGCFTKNSYKNIDVNTAIYTPHPDTSQRLINSLDTQLTLKELNKCDSAFLVTVKNSENIHEGTRTTVFVDKVLRGYNEYTNRNIVIYEPNFISYDKKNQKSFYYAINHINNLMQPEKKYLVFCNEKKYSDSFQNTLIHPEFLVDIKMHLYSFPIDNEILAIKQKNDMQYRDVKKNSYFCYSETEKNIINDIVSNVLSEYIISG